MRAASGLLVAVLLTTCVISGTFAKYTTKSTGEDSARVATWGFNDKSSITLKGLFKTAYKNGEDAETVKSNNTDANVIAPGTTNSAEFKFDYTGTTKKPEVAYTFKVSTDGSNCDESIQNNKNIVWSLDGTEFATDESGTSWNKLCKAIEALAGESTGTKEYKPGELPEAFNNGNNQKHTVAWKWVYNTSDAADEEDTKMGNATDLADVILKITITATQVD